MPLSELEEVLVPIYNFHRFQVEATAKLISGIEYSYSVKDNQQNRAIKAVSAKQQRQALAILLSTLTTKTLTLSNDIVKLIPPKAYGYSRSRESFTSKTGLTFDPVSAAQASAKHTISLLLNSERLARLQQQSVMDEAIPSVESLINALVKETIKMPADKGLALLVQQRVNQEVAQGLLGLWHNKALVVEVRSQVYVALLGLQKWLGDNRKGRKYKGVSAQFTLLKNQIAYSLSQGKLITPAVKIELPPGSPIGSLM